MNRVKLAQWGICLLGLIASSASALAGSIAINAQAPDRELVYVDDGGSTQQLKISWRDLQLTDTVRKYIDRKYGAAGRSYPFMIDRDSNTVQIFNKATGKYDSVSISNL